MVCRRSDSWKRPSASFIRASKRPLVAMAQCPAALHTAVYTARCVCGTV